ncbi:lytic transglycosylase domain-containing protein [Acidomonas methanolica]|nr:lytic transglycosylase domain-containing protein [Acidomonas methanolica]
MQGNASEFSLGGGARALVLGAMFLGSVLSHARAQDHTNRDTSSDRDSGQGEEVAFAVPREPGHRRGAPLPRTLSAADAAAVREVLFLQRSGRFDDATRLTGTLRNTLLLGDILADRYLNPAYHPKVHELRDWLAHYESFADAAAIQEKLIGLAGLGDVARRNFPTPLSPATTSAPALQESDPAAHLLTRNALLDHTVNERAAQGEKGARSAVRLIDATPGMTPLYSATLRAEIALTLLSQGKTVYAGKLARDAFERSGRRLGKPAYIAGLAAWRLGDPEQALALFGAASRAPLTDGSLIAAAAYWAARAERRMERPDHARLWLRRASTASGTFYGMLAGQVLGEQHHHLRDVLPYPDSSAPAEPGAAETLGEADVEAIAELPQGPRLFALLQLGEKDRAEAFLRRLWPDILNDAPLCHSVQLVAAAAGLDSLAEQIATILAARENKPADLKGFPLPHLTPRHGFRVDPALVYALTRLESNFDAKAASGNGAHGLMQIRPMTANFITGTTTSDMIDRLHNPGVNLEIGQLYLLYLASLNGANRTDSDLVHVLAGYNAGPSAIQSWEKSLSDDAVTDPLLFIETLPNTETRDYVQRALTYLWIYADKLDLPTPSLKRLAHAEWPLFAEEQAIRPGMTRH